MGTAVALAAKQATTTIPVVFGLVGDPVGSGVVPNLLEILTEALPRAQLVVMTRDPENRTQSLADANADTVAKTRRIRLHRVDVGARPDHPASALLRADQVIE